jgi:membrane-bound metal-dependent hydrolase YbcI (DUF457 family)
MEPIIHFVVPFIALTLVGLDVKRALPLSLLALLPDFDALFLVHRSLSHSLVVILAFAVPSALLAYRLNPRLLSYVALASLAVASHLILDLFAGYTPILWPLSNSSFWIKTELGVHIGGSMSIMPTVSLLMKPTAFQRLQSLDAPLFTGEGLIISLLLLAPLLLKAVERYAHRRAVGRDIEVKTV